MNAMHMTDENTVIIINNVLICHIIIIITDHFGTLCIKGLKTSPFQEIKYISWLLPNRYRRKDSESFDHQSAYKSNFWKYCKKVFQPRENWVKPDFKEQNCYNYFKKSSVRKKQSRECSTPSWIQKLDILSIGFHLEAPPYIETTKIIFKMKSSASPCPLDQVSIIVLKVPLS